jgi:soluble lytic murein transglycosylase
MRKKIQLFLTLGVLLVACSPLTVTPEPSTPLITPSAPSPIETPTIAPDPTELPTPVFSSSPYNDGIAARRNGDYGRAVAAFQLVLNANPSPELAQEAQYRLGEAYWLSNDDARAITALSAYLKVAPNGAHAPEARYLLADSYQATKDYANAIAFYKTYRDQSSTLAGDTDAAIADVMVLAGDTNNALAQYDRALQETKLAGRTRVNISMRAADVHLGRKEPALAAARYDAALAAAGDAYTQADLLLRAGEAYAAANRLDDAIARWNDAVNKYPDQKAAYQALVDLVNRNAAVDDFQRGLVDYNAGAYDAAIAALRRHLQNSKTPRSGDASYYIAASYARQGAYSQAIAEYDALIRSFPKDKRVPDAYLGKAGAYAAIGKFDDAVAVYRKFVAAFPDDALADDALWRAAVMLDRAKRYGDAADLYEDVQAKYPARERAAEALFWAGMDYYRSKDTKTAGLRWQAITKDYAKSSVFSRALFWLGKNSQARGQTAEAKNYWTQSAALNSGYYSWRAKEALAPSKINISFDAASYAMDDASARTEFEKWLVGWNKNASPATGLASLDAATRDNLYFKRGAELLRLDRTIDARRQFAALIEEKKDDPRALYALALYFRDNNLFSISLDCGERIARLANDAGASPAPRLVWMLRYPTYYADLVTKESKANNIDPLMYFALIRQESSFNPWVVSSADARGLAQIMPATGREIAQKLNVKNFTLDQLNLPFVSVRFGVWYLAQEMKNYDEPTYALAAYNAGGSRVKQWIKPDLDFAVEDIDISETAQYVRIVYSNWKQYQALYPVK